MLANANVAHCALLTILIEALCCQCPQHRYVPAERRSNVGEVHAGVTCAPVPCRRHCQLLFDQ